jgi:erythromycin esterase-like protein/predicted phosphoribosyltransferase
MARDAAAVGMRFRDRTEAGRLLAAELLKYAGREDVVVLALPRGGVPVGFEIARILEAPLDVFLVRKLGVPGHEEFALGAIATGGVRVLNRELVERLKIPRDWLDAIEEKEMRELQRREREYRGSEPPPDLRGRVVILVDDGLATGSTMLAAVRAARMDEPNRIVVAVPVADPEVCQALRSVADEVICLHTPQPLRSVGEWYEDFSQTTDDEVRALLREARSVIDAPSVLEGARRLTGQASDWDPILDRATECRFVLLGEASHGTREFYRARAEITKRLIAEQRCKLVAVEADWPDAYRVNRFVRGAGTDQTAEEALGDFKRFPTWMWRNTEVAEFVTWLREWNANLPDDEPSVGFYGLDLYSLHTSMEAVIDYLREVDPEGAKRARARYSCFDHFSRDPQIYAYEVGGGVAEPCEQQAVEQLMEMREKAAELAMKNGRIDEDKYFYAEQNARLVVNAERYYRAMFRGGIESWNLRDRHMAETLEELVTYLERTRGGPMKAAVWEHNSHIGDARATELGAAGELNVGQLVREQHMQETMLIGFTTHAGTVTAAQDWGGRAERRAVRPAMAGSWEDLFHQQGLPEFLLEPEGLRGRRLERAIGVIYRPETERQSHYFNARISEQFDAVIHLDETHAVEPLERTSEWETGELPETYPWGV